MIKIFLLSYRMDLIHRISAVLFYFLQWGQISKPTGCVRARHNAMENHDIQLIDGILLPAVEENEEQASVLY